ncbi:hypothetical protein phiA019_0057 [Aeromonas phage phiA019]|nr:hypothetical protein phiA009_0061 [Aeromonas phage phiA009]ULG01594.1 hypothetical protein phiA019_0057 [Aeromonas phage phiA019]
MCKKSPEQCKAKVKCKCCIKRQEMSKLREAYLEAKENGEVKSYKITLDSNREDDTLTLNEVDSKFEQQSFIIDIRGD